MLIPRVSTLLKKNQTNFTEKKCFQDVIVFPKVLDLFLLLRE